MNEIEKKPCPTADELLKISENAITERRNKLAVLAIPLYNDIVDSCLKAAQEGFYGYTTDLPLESKDTEDMFSFVIKWLEDRGLRVSASTVRSMSHPVLIHIEIAWKS